MTHELKPESIRVSRLTSGSVAATGFGDNFEPDEVAAAYPEWVASGYLTALLVLAWMRRGWRTRSCSC